jgi:hypothetical protein
MGNPRVGGTVNSMKQETRVFCQIDVQEFHLWFVTLDVSTVNKQTYS